jgi:DNA-binding beta-propeller fold protein YncE
MMPAHPFRKCATAALLGTTAFLACEAPAPESGGPAATASGTRFAVDASWPKPLPDNWIFGQISGVAVDSRDHVWVLHRRSSLVESDTAALEQPPRSACCTPAPPVVVFDQEGNVVRSWGGPVGDLRWPLREHGIYVDGTDHVWLAGSSPDAQVVRKFTLDGQLVLEIGVWGETGGSTDTARLGLPADVTVDVEAREVYVADGYGNRRVIVFDSETGAYKRHWGAYGKAPGDEPLPAYDPASPPSESFRSPMHAVVIARDGLVYTADRANDRIQVFRKSGEYVTEAFVAPETRIMGSVWDLQLSPDPEQTYLYVPDGANRKVWILTRKDLAVVGSFGRPGRMAGEFDWVHNIAGDSRGNLYTGEVNTGNRVQRWVPTPR